MGAIGYPVATIARFVDLDARGWWYLANALLTWIGQCGVAVLIAYVFRRDEARAWYAVVAYAATLAGILAWQTAVPGWRAYGVAEQGPWAIGSLHTVGVLAWGAAESLRCYAMLRRRLALGLADPVTADRFLLWGVSMVATCAIATIVAILQRILGMELAPALVGAIVGPLGLAAAACLWLAFMPPEAYLRRVRARAGEAAT
jgi:hypothetical protein